MNITYLLHPQYQHLQNELTTIKKTFDNNTNIIHKARNELKIINIQDKQYVVKSFKKPNFFNSIIYSFFKASKAKKSYFNAIELHKRGINTPHPIAVIEFYTNKLLKESYFISSYEPYDFTIREVVHHKTPDYKNILKEFAIFTAKLHQKGIWHEDYSLGNILITNRKKRIFSLVDINRMKFFKISAEKGLKNLNKLWIKNDEDLEIIARSYAQVQHINPELALKILKKEQLKTYKFKKRKKLLKKIIGKI